MRKSMLSCCELCPRRCRVDRSAGERGYCGSGDVAEVYTYAPHHGEEPPISGKRGSGTVFFSRCTLKCVYCQNFPWSQEGRGRKYAVPELAEIFRFLADAGCHNWNLVSPTPWLPMIREAVALLKKEGVSIPVVYNTSGYERESVLEEYSELADIFLPDLRYSRDESAVEGSGASGYVDAARSAIKRMRELAGPLKLDENGIAVSGVICRLLILPGRVEEVQENLKWLADTFGSDIAVSVMSQYMPAHKAAKMRSWNRGINREEYDGVRALVEDLDFAEGWVQDFEGEVAKDLIGFEMTPA